MNKTGEKHFREEESVREPIFRGKKLPLEVITCLKLDMFFGLRRQLRQDEILKIIFFSLRLTHTIIIKKKYVELKKKNKINIHNSAHPHIPIIDTLICELPSFFSAYIV